MSGLLLVAVLVPGDVSAHGGLPLRIGFPGGPGLAEMATVAAVYFEEWQGMAVELVGADSAEDLGALMAGGRIDVAVTAPDQGWTRTVCREEWPEGELRPQLEAHLSGRFGGAVAVPLAGAISCGTPAFLASPRALAELRYSTLRQSLEKIASAVGAKDLEEMARAGGGDPKKRRSAARDLLRRKGLL